MPDIETLRSLLARVEAAVAPDRELDGRIWAATAGVTILVWDGAGALWKDEHGGLRHQRDDRIPAYTASIDAAVALVERTVSGPRVAWGLLRFSHRCDANMYVGDEDYYGAHATPPLALLIALLRALIAKEEAHVV